MILHIISGMAVLATLCLCSASFANDSTFGEDNGTIVFKQQADISMDKEVLLISEKQVKVDYVFTNHSAQTLTLPVAFPMPQERFGDMFYDRITQFRLWVNGQRQSTTQRMVVLLNGKTDVTQQIYDLGWTLDDLRYYLGQDEPVLGWRPKRGKPLPLAWRGEPPYDPKLTIHEYFTWQQTFPAGQSVAISHAYKPSLYTSVPYTARSTIETWQKLACLDAEARTAIHRLERHIDRRTDPDHTPTILWSALSYILTTGNHWRGPIKDFTLILKKELPSDLISLCLDGKFTATDPVTLTLHEQNFVPKANLDVLFVRRDRYMKSR